MAKKAITFKTKGMNRDLSISAFSSEFSYENMNLRLSTVDGNTMLSWVNEKGTLPIDTHIDEGNGIISSIKGQVIGTAILNHQLVLFTTISSQPTDNTFKDRIYVLKLEGGMLTGKVLYRGNLNFSSSHPIETLVSYENENIQKVYWTDGCNQPRLINIAASQDKVSLWATTHNGNESDYGVIDTFFDFSPAIDFKNSGSIKVTKNPSGGGTFSPGVIQYCYTYYNKNGQQSNIVDVSPLYYLTHAERGASPEEKVSSSFAINIDSIDGNYDYVRLYSIQRTSINATPFVRLIQDFPVNSKTYVQSKYSVTVNHADGIVEGLILPWDKATETQIKNVTVTGGKFEVNINKDNLLLSFKNNTKNVNIVAIDTKNGKALDNIMSFQELIKYFYETKDERENATYAPRKYYFDLFIDQEQYTVISDKTNARTNNATAEWGISVDGTVYTGTKDTGFYLTDFVYSYADETWYILDGNNSVSTKEQVETTTQQIKSTSISYVDNGIDGSSVDPTELLYIGSRSISAYTMTDKDSTLFLGNIKENSISVPLRTNNVTISFNRRKLLSLNHAYGVYANTHQIRNHNQREITTFKGNEWYRFGIQLQMANGQWSDPIYIGDRKNTLYPSTFDAIGGNDVVGLVQASASVDLTKLNIDYSKVKRVRPLVVYPSIGERSVICQGVVNPTVFNAEDRATNSPFAQASWFFRPYNAGTIYDNTEHKKYNIDDYITVEQKSGTSAPSDDSNFSGHTVTMYTATVHRTLAESTSNNIHYYTEITTKAVNNDKVNVVGPNDSKKVEYITYDGFIQIDDNYQILFRKDPWPDVMEYTFGPHQFTPGSSIMVTQTTKTYYDSKLEFNVPSLSHSVEVYSDLKAMSPNNRYVYSKTAQLNSLDAYILNVDVGKDNQDNFRWYQVTFNAIPSDYYNVTDNVGSGRSLNYSHFDRIGSDPKNSEIQGITNFPSIKDYNTGSKTNNIFFIDQSIVTLNSPDIDFDSNVQSYAMENLKMRVVGFIPITSSASMHHITYKNSMVEAGYSEPLNSKSDTSLTVPDEAIFGSGESHKNVVYTANPISVHAGNRLVADYLWNDTMVYIKDNKLQSMAATENDKGTYNYMIYPWQRTGSLNTDTRAADKCSSYLDTKMESTILYSLSSKYLDNTDMVQYDHIGSQMVLTDGAGIMNVRLPHQHDGGTDVNYYPNIDKVLVNGDGYHIYCKTEGGIEIEANDDKYPAIKKSVYNPVIMKYKSTSHAVIDLCASENSSAILVMPNNKTYTGTSFTPYWEKSSITMSSRDITIPKILGDNTFNYLWLAELYIDRDENTIFGGNSDTSIKSSNWSVGGDTVTVINPSAINLTWDSGDTYYQRYDCLKTYPYTNEDPNQLVEILSFMCETRVNIDGRYDRNRGQIDNTMMSPVNFNLFNPVYTQKDNFFNYKRVSNDDDSVKYDNAITYTLTKTSGADVDQYTHITLASILEMDGDKGPVESLQRLNNNIIAFQDKGIAQILYNENVQLSTQNGVPVEIANSGKVQGKRYITDTVGCANKYTIVNCPSGIYFIDSYNKAIFIFNGQLKNLSTDLGFNAWSKKNIKYKDYTKWNTEADPQWSPVNFSNDFTAYYDSQNQDILFVNKSIALAYSEKFNVFTSFYDYGNTPYLVNLDGYEIFIRNDKADSELYLHNKGKYCNFFGKQKPYWMTLVGNPEPQQDKIFTNLEFRACIDKEGETVKNEKSKKESYVPYLPFDSLETWNEYQHGYMNLLHLTGHQAMIHHTLHSNDTNDEALKRKFRIWRCDIPRDNAPLSMDQNVGILRHKVRPLDRMRNPWIYLKLGKNDDTNHRTEIHDISMEYYV